MNALRTLWGDSKQEMSDDIRIIEERLANINKKDNQQQDIINKLEAEIKQLKKEVKEKQATIEDLKFQPKNKQDYRRPPLGKIGTSQSQDSENDTHQMEIAIKESEITNLKEENARIFQRMEAFEREKQSLEAMLKKKNDEHIEQLRVNKQNIEWLQKEGTRKEDNIWKLENGISRLQSENQNLQLEVRRLKVENERAEYNHRTIRAELDAIISEKKKVKVYMAVGSGGDHFQHAINQFKGNLITNLKAKGLEVTWMNWDGQARGSQDDPVLVFCLNTSRLGTDVSNALEKANIKDAKTNCLVIMHHQARHTKVTSSEGILSRKVVEEYHIKQTTDCIFWSQDGFYDCKTNSESIEKMTNFIHMKQLAKN